MRLLNVLVLVLVLGSGSAIAGTIQDFDAVGTAYLGVPEQTPPAPAVQVGGGAGETGQFIRLINNGVVNNYNRMHFDQGDAGTAAHVTAEFDFRINGAADGFSMLFLPTSTYGTTAAGNPGLAAGQFAEEPNFAGVFAVGFDMHSNIDEISLHYGSNQGQVNKSGTVDINSGQFHHARIDWVDAPGANTSTVTVAVTEDINGLTKPPVPFFVETAVPVDPYNYRVQFSGRTGGLSSDVDLDNINAGVGSGTAPFYPLDVTAPGDPIFGLRNTVAGGANGDQANWPSGEPPAYAINDNIGTKYLNFGQVLTGQAAGENTGFYVTPAAGATLVGGLRFATANDSPNRDPLTFTLEGTNADPATDAWTLIASGDTGLETDPGRNTWQDASTEPVFFNIDAYTSYRLLFPTVRGTGQNSMQIGEVEFLSAEPAFVPEPSTLLLAAFGLLGLLGWGWRRKR